MYCSIRCAGTDQALCGITALGKTHCRGGGASGQIIRLARGHAVAQLLSEQIGKVRTADDS